MRPKSLVAAALAATLAVAAAALGVGWYYADRIDSEALAVVHTRPPPDLVVSALTEDTITLRVTDTTDLEHGDWRAAGLWGLKWDGGYARVGEIVELHSDAVVRTFTPMKGEIAPGDRVRLDQAALAGDPLTALSLPFEEITFQSELGPLGAWHVAGSSSTWAILIHGHRSTREGLLHFPPPFAAAGLPMLLVEYRNDAGVAPSASGHYDFGHSEWRDLEAAVRYALDRGAESVVLFGVSMGGAIAVSFLDRSELAGRVRAAVLDAPMLDFGDVVDFGAERLSLPYAFTWMAKQVAAWRFGLDWRALNYLRIAGELSAPILLFHGDLDRITHVRVSDALANLRPDIVTYVRVAGAVHSAAWNVDPEAYERVLVDFLASVLDNDAH